MTKTNKIYTAGKVTEETIELMEFEAIDRLRYLYTSIYKGKKTTSEMIQVGSKYFCRENSGRWQSYNEFCGPRSLSELPDVVEVKCGGVILSLKVSPPVSFNRNVYTTFLEKERLRPKRLAGISLTDFG